MSLHPQQLEQEGLSHHQNGRHAEALRCYQQFLEVAPDNLNGLNLMALVLIDMGRHAEAEQCISRMLNLDEAFVQGYNTLGIYYQQSGNTEKAVETYHKTIQFDASIPYPFINLANIYQSQGKWLDAISMLRGALSIQQNDPNLTQQLENATRNALSAPGVNTLSDAVRVAYNIPEFRPDDRPSIYFFCPDTFLSSAGMRRIYRYAHHLHKAGFNASVLHAMEGFYWPHAKDKVPATWLGPNFYPRPQDIIVLPEGCAFDIAFTTFNNARRFTLVLNWAYSWGTLKRFNLHTKNYKDYGIECAIAVSGIIADYIADSMDLPVTRIDNFVDTKLHSYSKERKKKRIAYVARKDDSSTILKQVLTRKGSPFSDYEWICCVGLPQQEYAEIVNESEIFLITSPIEGMPTSTLEAMASGALVVGYTGIGGGEFMVGEGPDQNAVIAETTNLPQLLKLLDETIRKMDSNPDSFDGIIQNALKTASQFADPDAERNSLVDFFKKTTS